MISVLILCPFRTFWLNKNLKIERFSELTLTNFLFPDDIPSQRPSILLKDPLSQKDPPPLQKSPFHGPKTDNSQQNLDSTRYSHSSLIPEIQKSLKVIKYLPTDLKFIRNGHFDVSPYCVTFQAKEIIRGKKTTENATVCIYTSEPMPVPMRLRDEKSKKIKKFNSNPSSLEQTKVSSASSIVLEYPEKVDVLQNASLYARVLQPVKAIFDKQNK
jgi:hypothetical protein